LAGTPPNTPYRELTGTRIGTTLAPFEQADVQCSWFNPKKFKRRIIMEELQTPEISSDDKLWAALSYIFTPLVPIIMLLIEEKKNQAYIKYHAVQALATGVVLIIVVPIIATVTLGCGSILWLIVFYWAYKAYQGEMFNIPVITNLIKGQGWV
jgi:uncharacterized protein